MVTLQTKLFDRSLISTELRGKNAEHVSKRLASHLKKLILKETHRQKLNFLYKMCEVFWGQELMNNYSTLVWSF